MKKIVPKHHYNDGLIKRESNQKDINYRTALADRSSLCRDKNCQLSTVNCQLSTVNYQLSTRMSYTEIGLLIKH